jgi:hypothetical protein
LQLTVHSFASLVVGWDAGPEGVDFCNEHGIYFIFDDPIVQLSGFCVQFFDWESFYVPEHYHVVVFLLGGRFGLPPIVGVGFGCGEWKGPVETPDC